MVLGLDYMASPSPEGIEGKCPERWWPLGSALAWASRMEWEFELERAAKTASRPTRRERRNRA
jgi:hypothetical protein